MKTDIVVIGSGIAGLYFALQAAEYANVMIVTKKELMESNSNYAQGGIAAVLDPLDNFESHIADTLEAGCQINNRRAVKIVVHEAPRHIHNLIKLGVGFNRRGGKLDLTREGGHSQRRIVHAHDATGKEVERALIFGVRNHPRITIYESHLALDLLMNRTNTRIAGVTVLDRAGKTTMHLSSPTVVLATGGSGQVYSHTTNPKIATGDGVAMAARLGAAITGMEFVQFHPTTLNAPGKPHFLLSEALRGEGAVLRNSHGRRFMHKYHRLKELAPRDIVSRAVFAELAAGSVYLDITHKSSRYIKKRFPYIYEELWWFGFKLDRDRIPVAPAAHYMCGGVSANSSAQTAIPGLYAIGEVAHTGVHGANRLASNSILECLVFAARANTHIKKYFNPQVLKAQPYRRPVVPIAMAPPGVYALRKKVQQIMWKHVGIIRSKDGLVKAQAQLMTIMNQLTQLTESGTCVQLQEAINLAQTGLLICQAAQQRPTSLGCHYISDATS